MHGCFWHRHEGCGLSSTPATNTKFWQEKFRSNVERDERNILVAHPSNYTPSKAPRISLQRAKSVTYVSGTFCYPCLGSLTKRLNRHCRRSLAGFLNTQVTQGFEGLRTFTALLLLQFLCPHEANVCIGFCGEVEFP